MTSPILQTFLLGAQWPTPDPFLFCAHHYDEYPESNGDLGPKQSLEGRTIGHDFAGIDGWNMYHGSTVPGFPQHPHRGFETITYVREGYCDHSDSLGAKARFGEGDMQWITAGSGIVHSEMFPLLNGAEPNPLHLFQIWLNLPAVGKMVDPYFSMYWSEDIPRYRHTDAEGSSVSVTSIVGAFDGEKALDPPPDSWAATNRNDVGVWHCVLDPGSSLELPAVSPGTNRALYCFAGDGLSVEDQPIDLNTGVALAAGKPIKLLVSSEASTRGGDRNTVECLVLQGKPLAEPVAHHGPFVMNTEAEIRQAIQDYNRTGFGGWPWEADDPTHGAEARRFVHRQGEPMQAPS